MKGHDPAGNNDDEDAGAARWTGMTGVKELAEVPRIIIWILILICRADSRCVAAPEVLLKLMSSLA